MKKLLFYQLIEERLRFSVDGGSSPFIFTDFMALHHLLLNGLPEPPHRRSSLLVA
jgi:hypothetical protein